MRNLEDYMDNFNHCLMREPPFCEARCPFHVDVPDFAEKIRKGLYRTAFKTYRDAVGFPRVVAEICPAPCGEVCPLAERGEPIALNEMEREVIALAGDTRPNNYNIPQRNRKVAVVGAGLSGLGCALRMAAKKYHVEVFERTDRIGGGIAARADADRLLADIEEQFQYETYTIHFNRDVRDRAALNAMGFDAVYVATGKGGKDFGLLEAVSESGDRYCLTDKAERRKPAADDAQNVLSTRAGLGAGSSEGSVGWFAGGGLIGNAGVYGLADGLLMGNVLDNFLKTGNLLWPKNTFETKMYLNASRLKAAAPRGEAGERFAEIELKKEAERCLLCRCDSCRMFCDLTEFFNKWPPRIRDEVFATTLPGTAEVKATPAKRLMSTCSQCGICKEVCPEEIDMGGLILAGRQSMHRQDKAPWVFHDFWVRDMEFADGEAAHLCRTPADRRDGIENRAKNDTPAFAFFPGCQIGAGDPDLVLRTYDALLSYEPTTGILLRCCGAPAEWSGNDEKHRAAIESIMEDWRRLGKPTLLAACPTCIKKFREYMPEVPVLSVYEKIDEWSDSSPQPETATGAWAVFDPCSARHKGPLKNAVRSLARKAGAELHPLPEQDEIARCCGFGGQPAIANPAYTKFVADRRIAESELPYLTYCVNCRDVFNRAGKEAKHILEALYPPRDASARYEKLPTVTERRNNRVYLKRTLLKTYWGEDMQLKEPTYDFELVIGDDLKASMDEQRILESEIYEVVDFLLRTGRKVRNAETGVHSGYKQVGHMTYWVEYREAERPDRLLLTNVYAHRMTIEMEKLWRGVRTEDYLHNVEDVNDEA